MCGRVALIEIFMNANAFLVVLNWFALASETVCMRLPQLAGIFGKTDCLPELRTMCDCGGKFSNNSTYAAVEKNDFRGSGFCGMGLN